jgi:stearoyl-CoA desaturase (delta-9 desaturase)
MYNHEAFKKILRKIDMSDLENEPIIMFHEKHYEVIHYICLVIIPTMIPWWLFGDTFVNSFCVGAGLRYIYTLHRTVMVNSVAHMWGWRPYDTSIKPVDNKIVSFFIAGEGWHNYHHVFPWDYKAAELGLYRWNFSTAVIDFFAWIGWAYDLKSVPREVVAQRVKRTGNHYHLQNGPWGWGDADIPNDNILHTETLYPSKEF